MERQQLKNISTSLSRKNSIPNYDVISETIASGVIGAYSYWLKILKKLDVDKLNEIVVSILDSTIHSL